jgi:hypothetical protein
MKHLRECLAESRDKHWRRVYAGLVLVEDLTRNGSPDIINETSHGLHFDLVQRLTFLERFQCGSKLQIEGLVRSKAKTLRAELVPKLQKASEEPLQQAGTDDNQSNCESSCSPGIVSVTTCSTAASAGTTTLPAGFCKHNYYCPALERPDHAAAFQMEPKGKIVLNGVVSVGHSDDTTDESTGEVNPAPVKHGAPKNSQRSCRRDRNECRREVRSPSKLAVPPSPASGAVETVDLLGL